MNEYYDEEENLGLSMDEEEGVQDAELVSDANGEGDHDSGGGGDDDNAGAGSGDDLFDGDD